MTELSRKKTKSDSTVHSSHNNRRTRKRRRLSLEQGHPTHLYRVDWQAPERGISSYSLTAIPPGAQQHQQQQQQPPAQTPDSYSSKSVINVIPSPLAELSLQDLSPFPETIWSYTLFLGVSLILWIFYLLLPRGYRKKYFNASRKRYAHRFDGGMPPAGYWVPANRSMSDVGNNNTTIHDGTTLLPPILQSSSTMSSFLEEPHPGTNNNNNNPYHGAAAALPSQTVANSSPEHPALKRIPPNKIIAETMGRLQGRGIRLVAHGVHCDPKRVWIKLDDETQSVTWQTEFPRRVPNPSGQVSIVLMRGSVHRIALTNVLYIDVGKKTNALLRLQKVNDKVPDPSCFSLLTQNGSLDLQANSKLERDALVSCFSMILDDVHANEDWRALYEASPEPSLVNTSVGDYNINTSIGFGGGASSSSGERRAAAAVKQSYPNPSDLLIEV